MAEEILERIDSFSPCSAGLNLEGGRAVWVYDVSSDVLPEAIGAILGRTEAAPNEAGHPRQGGLIRILPAAHPYYPWMFAERISEIRGFGVPEKEEAVIGLEGATLFRYYAGYPRYRLTVEFTPRPYTMATDATLGRTYLEVWYSEAGATGTATNYYRTGEINRYVDWEHQPNGRLLTIDKGQAFLAVDNTSLATKSPPHGNQMPGMASMYFPGRQMILRWHQVPYRFVESVNSYFDKYQGRVNQDAFWDCPPGTVLYEGVRVRRYTPPFPAQANLIDPLFVSLTLEKLCDIDIILNYRNVPKTGTVTSTHRNYIANGHNLAPWMVGYPKGWYYLCVPDSANYANRARWQPTYLSFPMYALFSDPDVTPPPV